MAKKSKILKQRKLAIKSKYSTRAYHRCKVCGREGGYVGDFGLCRICFRELAHKGYIPGITKSSW